MHPLLTQAGVDNLRATVLLVLVFVTAMGWGLYLDARRRELAKDHTIRTLRRLLAERRGVGGERR